MSVSGFKKSLHKFGRGGYTATTLFVRVLFFFGIAISANAKNSTETGLSEEVSFSFQVFYHSASGDVLIDSVISSSIDLDKPLEFTTAGNNYSKSKFKVFEQGGSLFVNFNSFYKRFPQNTSSVLSSSGATGVVKVVAGQWNEARSDHLTVRVLVL